MTAESERLRENAAAYNEDDKGILKFCTGKFNLPIKAIDDLWINSLAADVIQIGINSGQFERT